MISSTDPKSILSLPLGDGNETDAKTVGQYLVRMAEDAFLRPSRNYPFGTSEYETPLIFALANADLMWLRTDENGLIDDYPEEKFNDLIKSALTFLFQADLSTLTLPPEPKEWYLVCVEKGGTAGPSLTDYFGRPYTEKEAKAKAEVENENYNYHAWVPVHIPA